jgi:hypothetical protein
MKQEAKHLLAVLRRQLNPMPTLPSPERIRLEEAMQALADKVKELDNAKA